MPHADDRPVCFGTILCLTSSPIAPISLHVPRSMRPCREHEPREFDPASQCGRFDHDNGTHQHRHHPVVGKSAQDIYRHQHSGDRSLARPARHRSIDGDTSGNRRHAGLAACRPRVRQPATRVQPPSIAPIRSKPMAARPPAPCWDNLRPGPPGKTGGPRTERLKSSPGSISRRSQPKSRCPGPRPSRTCAACRRCIGHGVRRRRRRPSGPCKGTERSGPSKMHARRCGPRGRPAVRRARPTQAEARPAQDVTGTGAARTKCRAGIVYVLASMMLVGRIIAA